LGSFRKRVFLWEIVSSELVASSVERVFGRNCEYWIGSSVQRVLWEIVSFVNGSWKERERERERERFEMKCVLRGLSLRRMDS
jgi:hypothetical protein